ncbi:MAG: phosphate ABC transporter permease subunit PstC [Ignavibacteriota bacterium]
MATDQHERGPLKLGKKFRFGEWLVESGIRTLSFISFAAIILIFVFVFKEASPIFFGKSEKEKNAAKDSIAAFINTPTVASTATEGGVEKVEKIIKGKGALKGTDITVKVDESGHKKRVTTNGGKIEQETYDPFADDTPTAQKVEPVKKEDKKTETPKPAAEAPKKPDVATTVESPKKELKSSVEKPKFSTNNGGKIEQEVFDPFADEKGGIPTIKGQKGTLAKSSNDTTPPTAIPDAAQIASEKAEADSLLAKEKRDVEEANGNTGIATMLSGDTWQPVSTVPKFGMLPLIIGTLKVTFISLLFGAPLAILAALFTSMFAPKWAREIIKPVIELLAGFPSVVIGFFALIVMATLFQDVFHYQYRLNSFVGGIAMSFAIIPIIYTISEDALTAVPHPLRDASTALGATRWQTAFKIVLPAAVPGVFAAIILGFGRAFGETMIALMATGNAPLTSANILEPVRTFAATIGAEMAEVVFGDQHYNVLFLIGAMLFVFTFTLNSVVEFYVRKKLLKRIQGK